MDDEIAFLRAIAQTPDDDAPRLVYADWLDERGDGSRAGFLRAETALRRAAAHDPSYPAALDGWLRARDAVPTDWADALGPRVNGLPLPTDLVDLLARGRWGTESVMGGMGAVQCPSWYLYQYSAAQMRTETANVCDSLRWLGMADPGRPPGDLDPRLAVLIGDEGIGSDSPFALDYRATFGRPRVLLLRWLTPMLPTGCRWVEVAPDVRTFLRLSGGSPTSR